jgi:hypothetical protein
LEASELFEGVGEAERAVRFFEFLGEGVPFGGVEMVIVVEVGHPGKNTRMISRATASYWRWSMGTGESESNWPAPARRAGFISPIGGLEKSYTNPQGK